MELIETSLIWRLCAYLCAAARESAICRALERFVAALVRGARESVICRFLWREGAVAKAWPHSLTCRVGTGLLNLPVALLQWLYKVGKPVWDGSLVFRAVTSLGGLTWMWLGLLALVMLVAPHEMWNNVYGLLGAAAVTALFVVRAMRDRESRLAPDKLGPYAALYMVVICGTLISGLSFGLSLRFFLFHLTGFLIALLAVSAVRRVEQLQMMCALAVTGLTVAALYGCYQGVVGVEVDPSLQDMVLNVGMPGRAYSFFDNPNNFAELIVMLLPLDAALFLNARTVRGKVVALFAAAAGLAAIGYTLSRSGWIGLAVAACVFLLLWNWRLLPVVAVVALMAIPFLPESIWNRILTIGNMKDTSTSYRFAIYGASENLMADYWWRGVGLGNDVMRKVFQTYPPMFDGNYPIHTHNNYLQMWGETGILGFLVYLGMLGYQVKSGAKAFCASADRRLKNLLAAALAGFCGILVIGLAEYTWFYPRNMFIYFFLFGVIAAGVKLARQEGKA